MTITALYARVSTEKQEKQETVSSQLEALRQYAADKGFQIFNEYIDEGYSGELIDRPALDRLRDDAKNKLFNAVLIHSPDRLSRKFHYLIIVQEELKKYGINIVFLNRPENNDTPEDNLLNGVQGLIAEYEKAKILERTRRGKIHKAKQNIILGSFAPYGYKYVTKNNGSNNCGYYKIVQNEAETVKLIFDLLINKQLSNRGIAKELTMLGIKPQRGTVWRASSVGKILRNETYTGIANYNKHISVEPLDEENKYRKVKNSRRILRPKEQWIPITLPENLIIIDRKTFEIAQQQLIKNAQLSPRNVKHQYLLRGMIECGNCNSLFRGEPSHNKRYYRCSNRTKNFPLPRTCTSSSIKAETIENAVWDKLCEVISDPDLIMHVISQFQNEKQISKNSLHEQELEAIDKKLQNLQNEKDRIIDAFREGIISKDELKSQMTKIEQKRKTLESQKRHSESKILTFPAKTIKWSLDNYCQLIAAYLKQLNNDDFDSKRHILSLAVDNIILSNRIATIKAFVPVENYSEKSRIATITSGHYANQPPPPLKPFLRVPAPLHLKNHPHIPNIQT